MKPRKKYFLEILKVFDFFKEAFRINKNNKKIYKPKLMMIAINGITGAIIAGVILNFINKVLIGYFNNNGEPAFGQIVLIVFLIGGLALLLGIFGLVVDAGLSYMYVKATYEGETNISDFWYGVKRYFWPFFLGKFLICIVMMILAIPIAFVQIFAGAAITIVVSVFTMMWKISIIVNNKGTIEGIKDGLIFAKNHILPLSLIVMVESAVLYGGSATFALNYNLSYYTTNLMSGLYNGALLDVDWSFIENYMGIGSILLVIIVVLAVICIGLYNMVLNVYFGITYTVTYKDGFSLTDNENKNEFIGGTVYE
jgi:hypothetical protein